MIDTHLKFDRELETKRSIPFKVIEPRDGFVEGLSAVVVEEIPSKEELSKQASGILKEAENEAKGMLDQAKKDAEKLKSEAIAAAQKKGYDEGQLQLKREAQKLKTEYEEKNRELQKEYEDMTKALEPQMADIIASLVEKITGIFVEDKEEVILYLVEKAIKSMDKSSEYTIRVSKEDYDTVSSKKDLLIGAIGRDVPVYITEDAALVKNQCLIETDVRVINCSLDVQLGNLISDLKLIGGI
jgi:flagellar assembly protein FliH